MDFIRTDKIKVIFSYIFALFLSLVLVAIVLRLWHANLNIPFRYAGDAIQTIEFVKTMINEGWILQNSFVGAPYTSQLYDFPTADTFHYVIMRIISLFNPNPSFVVNIYYILTFPLTTLTSLFVLRNYKVGYLPALTASILFTFIPYHFLRGISHLFLSSYYMVPLIILISLELISNENILINFKDKKLCITQNKLFTIIIIFILISSTGVYYAFFACFLFLLAGISAAISYKSYISVYRSLLSIIIVGIGVVINLIPNILFILLNGSNKLAASRNPIEAEVYGMKLTQLFIPVYDHGISVFNKIITAYSTHPNPNEGSEYLGIVGSVGFMILVVILFARDNDKKNNIMDQLSRINIGIVLLATIGGFGSLFAILVSPQIRAYNRISIFIAFLSLFALFYIINNKIEKYSHSFTKKNIVKLFTVFLLIIGILDQTSKNNIPSYDNIEKEYKNDEMFVQKIESILPEHSMVFQLPFVPFPEHPPVYRMGDYELFKGYIHSKTLRWSYGSMKGREGSIWANEVASQPTEKFLETIVTAGFEGLYIDRFGYEDNGDSLEKKIKEITKMSPVESENNRLAFYDLSNLRNSIKKKFTEEEWSSKVDEVLHPILFDWNNTGVEGSQENNWRWLPNTGTLTITNTSSVTRIVGISMEFATGYDELSNLKIKSSSFSDSLQINSNNKLYSQKFLVPPGSYTIEFTSDAKRIVAPNDPRILVFRVINFNFNVEK
ncbi:hypothetical protein [Paenibacillus ferrarius]|uniref:hypothetical protein n=1 Tax=Paenibacillus ferrarius TaxID=1469647 RepID=UPI003D299453